jgi:hypothetical protein
MADDEVKIVSSGIQPGQELPGTMLRPEIFEAIGAIDGVTGGDVVALVMKPGGALPNFDEPMTILIPVDRIDLLINMLRVGKGLIPKGSKA